MVRGDGSALDRDVIWHKVYNLLRDHGQKGMPLQALSGVDIALVGYRWARLTGLPLHALIGGAVTGIMCAVLRLRHDAASTEPVAALAARFTDEAAAIQATHGLSSRPR